MTAPSWKPGPDGRPLKWEGGRVKVSDGRDVWVIERQVAPGYRRAITLDVNSLEDAKVELALFNRDPLNYQTKRKEQKDKATKAGAVVLAPGEGGTLEQFKAHYRRLVEKGHLSEEYVDGLLPYLGQWAKALNGADLRKVDVGMLKKLLKAWKGVAEHKRVVALKAFTAWMREDGTDDGVRLHRNQDPTIDLKTPEIIPAKSAKAKGYPIKFVERYYAELNSQASRDIVHLRAKLGVHDTEIGRIARGEAELRRVGDPSGIEGVIVFAHLKKGKMHALSVDAPTFAAAERMRQRGEGLPRPALQKMLDRAAIRVHGCGGITTKTDRHRIRKDNGRLEAIYETRPCKECARLLPGELRHSFATWATTVGEEVHPLNQRGVDLNKVSERMGHLTARTTAVFYVGDRVPMMIKIPIRLEHPEDPVPMQRPEEKRQGA